MKKFESQQSKLEVVPESEKEKSKKELKDKLKKYFKNITTYGLISLTTLGISMWTLREMKKNKELLKYVEESKREQKTLVGKFAVEKQEAREAVVDIKRTKEMVERAQYLEDRFGPDIIVYLALATKKEQQAAAKEKSCPPEIIGFENLGFKKESLQKLWSEEYYPEGSINEEVKSIEYGAPLTCTETKPGKQVIYFRSYSKPGNAPIPRYYFLSGLDGRFFHELAHINDWKSASDLSLKERIEFLAETTARFESEDSFQSQARTASIEPKELGPRQARYELIAERWADACEAYFLCPDAFKKVYSKDAELIEKWLKRQDPDYSFSDAVKQKREFIKSITMNGDRPNS